MTLKNSKIIAAALSLGLVLSACGNNAAENKKEEPAATTEENTEAKKTEEEPKEETKEETKEEPAAKEATKDTANQADYDFSVISREEGSGTRGAFIELVGLEEEAADGTKEDKTTVDAVVQNSTNGVMTSVAQDPNAIGYISLGSLNDTVKAVKVEGVEATEENIVNGSYKISRPFNLAYKEDKLNDISKDFLAYCLSTEAQEIVKEEGYVPLSDTKAYEGAEGLSGSITVAGSTSVTPLMEKFIEAYKELNPDVQIDLQSTGSSSGIEATIDESADIAMASRELKDEEKEQLTPEVIATDGIAVVVNTESKVEDLTVEQLRQIFSGEITNTGDLK
ncbi:substrate-binding domain-containing protein [Anaerococcus urinomassiliensis]|uniref:substrate-binding domain-containing protein n=1 Tax=Anaerococcus urinomassiliensis TaxID=1745712 RepID=UPI00093A5871|nr:substrate-binding domain-containing protein [Anaerococcus urinomassiliensis]